MLDRLVLPLANVTYMNSETVCYIITSVTYSYIPIYVTIVHLSLLPSKEDLFLKPLILKGIIPGRAFRRILIAGVGSQKGELAG